MLKTVVGIVAGCIVGIAIGASFVAPGIQSAQQENDTSEAAATDEPMSDGSGRATAPGDRVLRWRLSSTVNAARPHVGAMIDEIGTNLQRLSNGAFTVRYTAELPGKRQTNGSTGGVLGAVTAGSLDAVFTTPDAWGQRSPALWLFAGMPFGPDTAGFLSWFYGTDGKGAGRALYQELHHKYGTHGILCGVRQGGASGWFREPITHIGDFEGRRVRASGLTAQVYAALGATPAVVPDKALLSEFEAQSLDAATLGLPSADAQLPLDSVAPYYYLPGWQRTAGFYELVINLKRWEAVSDTQKARLESACRTTILSGLASTESQQFSALKALQARNVDIRRWPAPVLEQIHARWMKITRDLGEKDPNFKKVWQAMTAYFDDYTIWRELQSVN